MSENGEEGGERGGGGEGGEGEGGRGANEEVVEKDRDMFGSEESNSSNEVQ